MGKYTIVSKDKPGNKYGQVYTITYQVEGYGSDKFKVDLYCRGYIDNEMTYCYSANSKRFGIDTASDRDEFLREFYAFQKGGSYRKTNPIKLSMIDNIKNQILEKKNELYELERQLSKEESIEQDKYYKTYYIDVDRVSLNEYVDNIKQAFKSNRYYVKGIEFHIWEGHRIFIYDSILNKPVQILSIKDGEITSSDLGEYEIKNRLDL